MECYDEGRIRAYVDGALDGLEHAALAAHLHRCAACRERLADLQRRAADVGRLLAPAAPEGAAGALSRFYEKTRSERQVVPEMAEDAQMAASAPAPSQGGATVSDALDSRSMPVQTTNRTSGARRWLAAVAALIAVAALLALPPVRAAADQLLSIFRVQNVVFLPVSQERIEELENLNFDGKTLFMSEPEVIDEPEEQSVATADEAAATVDFTPGALSVFPSAPLATEYVVRDEGTVQFQVDVETARQLLTMLNITDVTLPDSLGDSPIVVEVDKTLQTSYRGSGYTMSLVQGGSPTVSLPDGVDLAQLGKAALRLLGMEPAQAEALSRQIDWSTTLIFPFPANVRDVRTVDVNGAQGLMFRSGGGGKPRGYELYWQQGDRFYMLQGSGDVSDVEMIAAAQSVR